MKLEPIIDRVVGHLRGLGVIPELAKGDPATVAQVRAAEGQSLPFPDELKDIFLNTCDGVVLFWEHEDSVALFKLPSLVELVDRFQAWKGQVLWMDEHEFPHTDDPSLAKKTYAGMKAWLPLFSEEGGADAFCIECGSTPHRLVFHQHDWYDGGTGRNGHVVSQDLMSFIRDWANVCFTGPTSLYWPSTFTERGLAWTSENFDPRFIIPS